MEKYDAYIAQIINSMENTSSFTNEEGKLKIADKIIPIYIKFVKKNKKNPESAFSISTPLIKQEYHFSHNDKKKLTKIISHSLKLIHVLYESGVLVK